MSRASEVFKPLYYSHLAWLLLLLLSSKSGKTTDLVNMNKRGNFNWHSDLGYFSLLLRSVLKT